MVQVLDDMGIVIAEIDDDARDVVGSYNVAPTRTGLVVAARRPVDAAARDAAAGESAEAGSRLAALAWGLVPTWATDRRVGSRMINARIETLMDKNAFRPLMRSRRCLVPADGWFEWHKQGGKQPYFVRSVDEPMLLFAGLYTWWLDPAGAPDPVSGRKAWFGSYTILTTAAAPDLAWLHDRMPVALRGDLSAQWLDGDLDDGGARHLLAGIRAAPGPTMAWHPVDRRVGAVANDDATLVTALPE